MAAAGNMEKENYPANNKVAGSVDMEEKKNRLENDMVDKGEEASVGSQVHYASKGGITLNLSVVPQIHYVVEKNPSSLLRSVEECLGASVGSRAAHAACFRSVCVSR